LAIRYDDESHQFLRDITDLAISDCLYRAIHAITELDTVSMRAPEFAFRSRMDRVRVFFDTLFVLRALGYSHTDLVRGAREVLNLCKSTGCHVCVFDHTVSEIKRIFRATASNILKDNDVGGDIEHYAFTSEKTASDIVDMSAEMENQLQDFGFDIVVAPLHEINKYSLDEIMLSERLRIDLKQKSEDARNSDVDWLTVIYRLRKYEPKVFLEDCDCIFVTTDKDLADSSARHFRKVFQERHRNNRVQICMTDVVFATRLWTKLPTSVQKLPREQILSHILSNFKPTKEFKDSFINYLNQYVINRTINEDIATKMKLSCWADEVFLIQLEAAQRELSESDFISIANKVLVKNKEFMDRLSDDAAEAERDLEKAIREYEQKISEMGSSFTEKLQAIKERVERADAVIKSVVVYEERIKKVTRAVAKFVIVVVFLVCFASLGYMIMTFVGGRMVFLGPLAAWLEQNGEWVYILGSVIMAVLTLYGLSVADAVKRIEDVAVRKVMMWLLRDI
jgi:hypothetical protein